MKFIVAIDWKTNAGYTFLELKSKTEAEAMIEAPAVASAYAGMRDVYCLRLLTQTKKESRALEATLTPHRFYPELYRWDTAEGGSVWSNIDPVKLEK